MQNPDTQQLTFNPARLAHWSIILTALVLFLVVAKPILLPMAIAFLLWALLDAIRNFLLKHVPAQWPMSRGIVTFTALVILIAGNMLVLLVVVAQLEALSEAWPEYHAKLLPLVSDVSARLGMEEVPRVATMLEKMDVGSVVGWAGSTAGSMFGNLMLVALYLGFMLAEEKILTKKSRAFSSNPAKSERIAGFSEEISGRIQLYIGMKTAVSALTGFLAYLLLLWVGVDFAALWGLLIFMLNFIPNVGSMLGVAFPALLSLIQFDGVTPFLIVTFGLIVINFFVGNIVEPAYMGKELNLSPLMILFSLSAWGAVWGLAGMFLSVPLMVVTAIVCSHFKGLSWISVMLSADGNIVQHNMRTE